MSTLFNILSILVMMAVVIVLIRGLMNMMRGGSANTSNKLMQARVILQAVAVVFVVIALYYARSKGG
ncbi:twin transmembrane helix small protein [Nitratireductor sp. GISD-1A_MAKvit]|uniref:twin transmembrane helix small protein n=1 Tax=Nitratireductor sp. GISD-1A_MAKvit TaxID=3234198 RepID=UPI0034653F42